MTSLEEFKEIIHTCKVQVPEDSLEVFRDFVDLQADTILDQYLTQKKVASEGVK